MSEEDEAAEAADSVEEIQKEKSKVSHMVCTCFKNKLINGKLEEKTKYS